MPSAYVHTEPYAQSESRITGLWGSAGNPTPPVGGKNREARVWGARGRGRERERERRGKEMEGEGREIGRFDGSLVSAVRVSTDAHHRRCAVLMGP